jgi:hypothetical protein
MGFLKNSLILKSEEFFYSNELENFLFEKNSVLKNICQLSYF